MLHPPLGSPPRGRGKAHELRTLPRAVRITPAWAGKSQQWPHMCGRSWDHPRVGGEKQRPDSLGRCPVGSPPRGRGKGSNSQSVGCCIRITPAWAGKSFAIVSFSLFYWDHPRVGGEKTQIPTIRQRWKGSPPRGRGKASLATAAGNGKGITPAWAGKRGKCGLKLAVVKDHPRVGGEKPTSSAHCQGPSGSPPRGRGKAAAAAPRPAAKGITPAWAGKRERIQP